MTSITPLPDDTGTRSLKSGNEAPDSAKSVTEITPYPRIHPAQSSVGRELAANYMMRHIGRESYVMCRHAERRTGERRKKDVAVSLDTRSNRERRIELRRESDQAGHRAIVRGIDTYS